MLATHGDTFLGGDDVDLAMALSLATKFNEREGVDLRGRTAQWRRLLLTCEEAKRRLSRTDLTTIEVPDVANTSRGVLDLAFELTRTDLEVLVEPIVRQTIDLMLDTLALAGLDIYSVDQVLLVGGSSRLPLVRSAVRQALGKTPLIDLDPDTAVAIGAAIEAHRLHGGTSPSLERLPREIVQVVPHAIGLATAGGGFDPVIPRNSPLPVIGERSYTTWREAQQEMRFVVLQGDSANAADNARLGAFVIDDLPRRPAGEVEVKLTLEVGTDGLLRASARDTFSNKVHRYRIRVSESPRGGW